MKKLFLLLYISFVVSLGFGVDIDYGASVDSYVGASLSDSSSVFGFEKVSLYSSFQFTENFSLAVDGFYKFNYSSDSVDNPHTFDFATFVATLPIGNTFMMAGRNSFQDYSGDILSHTLDGISITIPLGFGTLLGKAAYSGLVNDNEVSLFTTAQDGDVIRRIIEGADIVKDLEAVSVWGSLYSLQDMNSLSTNLSVYGGGGVSGSIGSDIYYTARGNFQSGLFSYLDSVTDDNEAALIYAGMGAVTLNWYIKNGNELFQSMAPYVSFDFGISSGDSDLVSTTLGVTQSDDVTDGVSLYSPLVTGGPGVIYSVNNQNLTYFKLQGSVSPLKDLQTQLGTVLYFRTVEGVTSDSDVNADADGHYMGTEVSVTANYRPFSDLGVAVTGGVFFPDGTVLSGDPSGLLSAYVSLSL